MRRREFVSLAGSAVMWPLAAAAQQKPMPVIGILDPDVSFIFDAFVRGMSDLGYVEGKNIAYLRKVSQGPESLPSLAAELVDLKVNVIVTGGTATWAARGATTSIPIVFVAYGDPVSVGFVSSLSHPGGNLTGLSFSDDDLSVKRLDLLREMVPNLRDVGVFYWPGPRRPTALAATEQAGRKFGLQLHVKQLPSVDLFEPAFQEAAAARVDAVAALASPFFNANRERLAQLAAKYRLPAIYESGEYVRSGCLIAYGPVFTDMARRGATFVDKILKGAKPSDLPVEVTTKFELTINLKAAQALGRVVPTSLRVQADELIE